MKERLLGYAVDSSSRTALVEALFKEVCQRSRNRSRCVWLACLNPHSYAVATADPDFAWALRDANWLIPDGTGIVLASKILGGRVHERITGSDIFSGMHVRMNATGGMSVFFLGSSESTLALMRERMKREFPNIKVAGTYSPPFKSDYTPNELDAMIRNINEAKPDVLWVGMTAPKQEKWICANYEKLDVGFAAAIGAVFDFYTGQVKRPHPFVCKLGLEWLSRLIQEPRRLWRRTFVSGPIFVRDLARARLREAAKPALG